MKLTDAVIKNINHQDKDQFFSMQGTEGLTLVVYKYPSRSKTWFYQYRPKGKNSIRLKVGTYEELGINKAISRAKIISNEIFSGKDPSARLQIILKLEMQKQLKFKQIKKLVLNYYTIKITVFTKK